MQAKSANVLTAAFFSMFVVCTVPSLADSLSNGAAAYAARNYPTAKLNFIKATQLKPKSWQAHYQLANTYVALKDSANAKLSYQKCISCHPPDDIKANCTNAISYIAGNPKLTAPVVAEPPRPVQMISPKSPVSSGPPPAITGDAAADPGVKPEIAAMRARAIKEGEDDITKMKAQEKERHDEMEANSSQRFLMPDGSIKYKLTDQEEAQFQKDVEAKATAIRDRAKRKAESIR